MDKDNKIIILLVACLVFFVVVVTMKSYELGFYNGLTTFCNETLGVDKDEEFVCYTPEEEVYNNDFFNDSIDYGWINDD